MELYIVGGRQKKRFVRPGDAEHRFESAVIIRLDTGTKSSEQLIDYKTMGEAKADNEASNLFTSSTLQDHKMYTCTYTEVLIFDVPRFKRVGYISLPRFNAVHHVCPTRNGTLLIANTGLDMVVETTLEGAVLNEWNVLGGDPWKRFFKGVDYRKVLSTKPHQSHPNFVFQLGDHVWVTRFHQRDALCLTKPDQNIPLSLGFPHDGLLHRGMLYFTTVDGHLIEANPDSLQITSTWNLRALRGNPRAVLGWCRGVAFIEKNLVWIGFTRIRKSSALENLNWIKHGFCQVDAPTHIALFDLGENRFLKKIDLESHGVNILFSIHPTADLI
jgi:hypothetical protein